MSFQSGRQGTTLREAALHASERFFPPSGKTPDPLLFTQPQFNTWIELTYDQNQRDVLAYAHAIVANGFPPAVLMIDEGWFEAYGVWDFHRGRFPDPKAMIDELHAMGFRVMVWVCPYIRPDGKEFTELLHDKSRVVWLRSEKNPADPAIMRWWDGYSAVVDPTSPQGREWFEGQLRRLVETYGVDGFKLDGGDADLFAPSAMLTGAVAHDAKATPNALAESYARVGLAFPLNEYRACWKMGGQPLAQRLRDKEHTWADLRKLVPGMVNLGLMGYPFGCPDLIGGGEYLSFQNLASIDQELIVRASEVHALMPMMQFSVAPWRVLTPENLAICRRMAALHTERGKEILALAAAAAKTGEPIVRSLEYAYPGRGYQSITDQFLLGPDVLVAPVVEKGALKRKVVVPPGPLAGRRRPGRRRSGHGRRRRAARAPALVQAYRQLSHPPGCRRAPPEDKMRGRRDERPAERGHPCASATSTMPPASTSSRRRGRPTPGSTTSAPRSSSASSRTRAAATASTATRGCAG